LKTSARNNGGTPFSERSRPAQSGPLRNALTSLVLFLLTLTSQAAIPDLQLPPRPPNAPSTTNLITQLTPLDLPAREHEIIHQFANGNVPQFWRHFASVKISSTTNTLEYFVAPDYLVIGSDEDYFLAPVSPATASAIADRIDCILPTPKMVDDIYAAAPVKMIPTPIPPTPAMTTGPIFARHNETVRRARSQFSQPLGALTGGHKKDVVLTTRLTNAPTKVAIYGWHQTKDAPIQPLYLGHTAAWVDYSHGARFVRRQMLLNGQPATAEAILADPNLCHLLSNEGPFLQTRYTTTNEFNEQITSLSIHPHVRIVINTPPLDTNKPTHLILYALPNGNTIEQTAGRKTQTNEDWHFDIQHIAAQIRFIRHGTTSSASSASRVSSSGGADSNYILAYLENAEKSWPAWRRAFDTNNTLIPQIVQTLRARFSTARQPLTITLTGHSGGGSFTFGYLNGIQNIPDEIERIAFLDSNYAYETAHAEKLVRWLKSSEAHQLTVLAYHDDIALLNGKTFVSANGGTWGRGYAMLADLKKTFAFTIEENPALDLQSQRALNGRIQFLLKENPKKEILHTRQVELNGFIHALRTGTPLESQGYSYFAPRAYEQWIAE
jgi:hypothetical protein